ncbi:MAG: arsenate reductase ArsC [Anaerolineales bacterium]
MDKSRVLFLCTGNSCRSQIAEAIVNAHLGDRWEAFSAGSHPVGYIHPLALKVLSEMGIDHHGRSKSMDEFQGQSFDVVVTLCDQADDECPVWLGKGRILHRPFPDPANVTGSEAEKLAAFYEVRDGIAKDIAVLLAR